MGPCPKCRGQMFYDAVDDNYTCLACGGVSYPELVSLEAIEVATGLSREDLVANLRLIQEPIRQGKVHKRAIKRLKRPASLDSP